MPIAQPWKEGRKEGGIERGGGGKREREGEREKGRERIE